MSALSDRRERFCQEYLRDACASKAARRAGYSEASAKETGYKLTHDVEVLERIIELQNARAERLAFTQDDVLRQLSIVCQSNVTDYEVDDSGRVHVREGMPAHMMCAVSSVTRKERFLRDGTRVVETQIRLWDKVAALRLAAQHLGMLVEQHEVKHSGEVRYVPPSVKGPEDADGNSGE